MLCWILVEPERSLHELRGWKDQLELRWREGMLPEPRCEGGPGVRELVATGAHCSCRSLSMCGCACALIWSTALLRPPHQCQPSAAASPALTSRTSAWTMALTASSTRRRPLIALRAHAPRPPMAPYAANRLQVLRKHTCCARKRCLRTVPGRTAHHSRTYYHCCHPLPLPPITAAHCRRTLPRPFATAVHVTSRAHVLLCRIAPCRTTWQPWPQPHRTAS